MKKELFVSAIAGLTLGVLAGCAQGPDAADAKVGSVAAVAPMPAAAPTPAHVPAVEPPAAPTPAAEPAAVAAEKPVVAARPAIAAKPTAVDRHAASSAHREPQLAKVIAVKDAIQTVSQPREVCHDEQVVKQAPVKDEHQIAGTVAGAVVGGVIGNQIGDGKGRKIAKVAGILGGAYAGNKVQEKMQKADTVTVTERRCETVTESHEQRVGYDVTYSYAGRTETVRTQRKPGATLPVKDGKVVID
jgi:uncharacterized protein YcfJ